MKIGKLVGYNLTTKNMDDQSMMVDVPLKIFADTVDDNNYEDITSIINWDIYGELLGFRHYDVRTEINNIYGSKTVT